MTRQKHRADVHRELLTLSDYLELAAREQADGLAFLHASSGRQVTYGEMGRAVDALARSFLNLGIKKGDVVSIQLPNWPEFVYVHFALAKIGAITNPINPVLRSKEVGYILRFSESVAIVIPGHIKAFDYPSMIQEMRHDLPSLRNVFVVDDDAPEGTISLKRMIDEAATTKDAGDIPGEHRPEPNDPAILMYTSGTTADPKGVVQTHRAMIFSGFGCSKVLGLGEGRNEVLLALPSFATSFGLYANLYTSIFHQATVITVDGFNAEETLRIIERESVTHMTLVPAQIMALLAVENLSQYDLSSLRTMLYAGAVCPVEIAKSAIAKIGCRLGTIYAMTECAPVCGTSEDDPPEVVCHTVGHQQPGIDLQIVNDDGRPAGIGETGEILVRGLGLFSGYFRRPDLVEESVTRDGWYRTGDLGWLDENGNVHIAGRKKDVINRGGLKISSREVEDLLFAHPDISDAAVVGMPDPKFGERSCAYVVPRPGRHLTLEDVIAYLQRKGLATFKLPERLEVVGSLPYTPSGKVQKFILRNDIQAKLAREVKENAGYTGDCEDKTNKG